MKSDSIEIINLRVPAHPKVYVNKMTFRFNFQLEFITVV